MTDDTYSRRRLLTLAAAATVLSGTVAEGLVRRVWGQSDTAASHDTARAGTTNLRTHVTRPYDAESDVSVFREWLTPNEKFFVRSHFGPPPPEVVDPARWRVAVSGLVDRPLVLTLDDLRGLERVSLTTVIQCSGNGRANHRPRVPGVQWDRGAVGNARWTGVRLADVLARAGVQRERARHVQFEGADRPVLPRTPLFTRSIPLAKAVHPDTLLALEMNDAPLPLLHGGPLRVITPGWMADACTKWVTGITVRETEAEGYYMQTAYRYPSVPVEPGVAIPPSEMRPVEAMVVKSLIATPAQGSVLAKGPVTVGGVAWTGEGRVVRVEVSTDGGHQWQDATLLGEELPYAWRQWEYRWDVDRSGPVTLLCRATDNHGEVQPERSAWNPSGFLWNGWDRVAVTVDG